jgi:UDP-N-acetylglucosamine 4,6-dehydratase
MTKELLKLDGGGGQVCIYSRGEIAQAEMARELNDDRVHYFIGDVRDQERLAMACRGVDTIIHAAALKRIEVGRYNPTEMVKTNVLGAMNVLEAAFKCGVKKVVALSTDKAWQPISPYGQSKALAESIFLNAYAGGPIFSVCRYGNVWKSAGSVVPIWGEYIKRKLPIPITDPECTRFFMTMDEAINLVLGAVWHAKHGELVIPTLPAYRLGDVATAMGAHERTLTDLPDWEKKHEGMADGNTSDVARRMTIDELRFWL